MSRFHRSLPSLALVAALTACQPVATDAPATLTPPVPSATGVPSATADRSPTRTVPPTRAASVTPAPTRPSATPRPSATSRAVAPIFTRALALKSPALTGDDVRWLQTRLIALGYVEIAAADGVFGAQTDTAVRRFQGDNGLTIDGVVVPVTWTLLATGAPVTAAALPTRSSWSRSLSLQEPAQTGDDVAQLQTQLAALGYFASCHPDAALPEPDGVFGAGTHSAVVAFQDRAGLTADGVVTKAVWDALFGAAAPRAASAGFTPPVLGPAPQPAQQGLIAFASDRDDPGGARSIYTLTLDGTQLTRLTTDTPGDFSPAWSPDGARLAFVSKRDHGYLELFVMNADGSQITQLTCCGALAMMPDWSPDGTQIVFASQTGLQIVGLDGRPAWSLHGDCCIGDREPKWSPDGAHIVFVTAEGINASGLWVVAVDGSTAVQVGPPGEYQAAAWSPDGQRLVFSNGHAILIMNADGSGVTPLTGDLPDAADPAWSPDGARIAFTSSLNGRREVWVMNADGSGLVAYINADRGADSDPDWQP